MLCCVVSLLVLTVDSVVCCVSNLKYPISVDICRGNTALYRIEDRTILGLCIKLLFQKLCNHDNYIPYVRFGSLLLILKFFALK